MGGQFYGFVAMLLCTHMYELTDLVLSMIQIIFFNCVSNHMFHERVYGVWYLVVWIVGTFEPF
jgi:hypothetical protein